MAERCRSHFFSAACREPFALYIEGMFTRANGWRKRRGDENPLNVVLPSEVLPSVLCVKGMFARVIGWRKRRGDEKLLRVVTEGEALPFALCIEGAQTGEWREEGKAWEEIR